MKTRDHLEHARNIERARNLIQLGARGAIVVELCRLNQREVADLFVTLTGKGPPRGQLPSSPDWYLEWQPNIHASLFFNIHDFLSKVSLHEDADGLHKAYQLYKEQTEAQTLEPLLSITRAWHLIRLFDTRQLALTMCSRCSGRFVTLPYENQKTFACGLCKPPSGAGGVARRPDTA